MENKFIWIFYFHLSFHVPFLIGVFVFLVYHSIKVLDYTQFYLDLASANTLGEAVWQPEYNLTTHYFGSGEVNAVALHNLADRFSNTENPQFAK